MRELAKELFHLVVFLVFITKSLDVVVEIHPPGKDQPAWMRPASQWSSKVGFFSSLYTFHLIPARNFPIFLLLYTTWARGQSSHPVSLGPCHGCPHHPLPYLHQSVSPTGNQSQADSDFFKDPPPALALPGAREKCGGGTTPRRASACVAHLALVTLHHRTAGWHWNGVF